MASFANTFCQQINKTSGFLWVTPPSPVMICRQPVTQMVFEHGARGHWSCSLTVSTMFWQQIFTEDLTEVELLPRDKVLDFLKEGFKELAVPYLEHIVYVWEETVPEFHNVLIQLYLERLQVLMKEYLNSLPEGERC